MSDDGGSRYAARGTRRFVLSRRRAAGTDHGAGGLYWPVFVS